MNKNFFIRILGFVVIIAGAYFLFHSKDSVPVTDISAPITETVSGRNCYAYDQVATTDAPYEVHENIDITITGDTVSGTKSGTQAGPDMTNGYEGTLTGTFDGSMMSVVFSYIVEGSAQKEKELYTVFNNRVIKHRYTLHEEDGILVPDTSADFREIVYNKFKCTD